MNELSGIELIAKERQEQIEKHGWTKEHDIEEHQGGELAYNASILAASNPLYYKEEYANSVVFGIAQTSQDWILPDLNYSGNVILPNQSLPPDKRIKQLIVAGALIAAEIDRLQKATN